MKELIQSYDKIRTEIATNFGLDSLWYNLIIYVDCPWDGSSREFSWSEDGEDGSYSSCDVYGTSEWVSKCGNYTLYVGDNGCGDRDMYLFSNANKKEEGYFDRFDYF